MSNVRRYAPFVVPVVVLVVAVLLSPVHRGAAPAPVAAPLAAGAGVPGVPATGGDRRHCVGGRQFGDFFGAPPCEPTWVGRPNGGATSPGVTGGKIEVVDYHDADDPRLYQLGRAAGAGSTPEENQRFMTAATAFVNAKYELWGRSLHVDIYLGTCSQVLPNPGCFANDARAVARKYHPFGVIYENNTDSPQFFATLSSLKVVNLGGYGFPASFDTGQRPFHYDVLMDGDTQAALTGSYWCRRLADRPARFAGSADLRGQLRKASILAVGTATGRAAARRLQNVIDRCDPGGADTSFYSPDITTAAQQSVSLIAQWRRSRVTDVLWLSDALAPLFVTPQMTAQNFFPENVVVGGGLLDSDIVGRGYDPPQWRHAFGLGDSVASSPRATQPVGVIFRFAGLAGSPTAKDPLTWNYLSVLAAGLQQAGPRLTPLTFEHGLLTLPPTGGGATGQPLIRFGPGDYTAISDAREVVWSPTAVSPGDRRVGAYRTLDGGRRFTPGSWPLGDPPLPPAA